MVALYNEFEPYPAQWLRNLSDSGHIAGGRVDARSIVELEPHNIEGYDQFHAFAGIGVWSHALRLAGWPDDVPVWTGSCPCQPFSTAGKKKGTADARHLWPEWFRLIRQCRPPVIFGEQVASPDGLNWLDAVSADLEGAGYTVGAADLCAAGVGAPHIRQRLYFVAVADAGRERLDGLGLQLQPRRPYEAGAEAAGGRGTGVALGDTDNLRAGRHGRSLPGSQDESKSGGVVAGSVADGPHFPGATDLTKGYWADVEWLHCRDGKYRPTQPGLHPLAHGATSRVGGDSTSTRISSPRAPRLRAYGNAIVPQVAAAFIQSAVGAIRASIL